MAIELWRSADPVYLIGGRITKKHKMTCAIVVAYTHLTKCGDGVLLGKIEHSDANVVDGDLPARRHNTQSKTSSMLRCAMCTLCALTVKLVTTPKLCPAPRCTQNRSAFSFAFTVSRRPERTARPRAHVRCACCCIVCAGDLPSAVMSSISMMLSHE